MIILYYNIIIYTVINYGTYYCQFILKSYQFNIIVTHNGVAWGLGYLTPRQLNYPGYPCYEKIIILFIMLLKFKFNI